MYYDVLIVGAGPCGLATAARLCERAPSALFTHDEHSRYWSRHNRKETIEDEERRRRKRSTDSGYSSATDGGSERPGTKPSILVLDAVSDRWMSSWRRRFQHLHITHLRSPLFFHPDPYDRDGLLAYTHEQGRTDELTEITNVVGKELSKHGKKLQRKKCTVRQVARHLQIDGRDKIDYFTPSTELFDDYCDSIIERYKLQDLVQQARVLDIEYGHVLSPRGYPLFTVKTSIGTFLARNVVIATSAGTPPSIPSSCCSLTADNFPEHSLSHVFTTPHVPSFLPPHTHSRLQSNLETTVLVVGGGLTSAQLLHHFLSSPTIPNRQKLKVHLLVRSPFLKVKPFDVDISWVTKTRNQKMAEFWSADTDEERLAMLREARNGGSMTPTFHKILQQYVDVEQGRAIVHASTTLMIDETCDWDAAESAWTKLNIQPPIENLPAVSHIVFATGATPDVDKIAYLKGLREDFPIRSMGGLPVPNDDLMWNDEVPLFFTGALAALRLGPGSANLMGARNGAERIAWRLEETLNFGGSKASTPGENVADGGKVTYSPEFRTGQTDGHKVGKGVREHSVFTGSFANQFDLLRVE